MGDTHNSVIPVAVFLWLNFVQNFRLNPVKTGVGRGGARSEAALSPLQIYKSDNAVRRSALFA